MEPIAVEKHSIKSVKASLSDFGSVDQRDGVQPATFFRKSISKKSGDQFSSEYEQESKALQWALKRLASWDLPGKEHVESYFRHMYRRNLRPKTYFSNLTAIQIFLTVVKDSEKTHLEEVTKNDLEMFIEHEQDRGLMLSTVGTRLHCANAFLGYLIEVGVVSADVLARRIRLKKPEALPRAMDPDDVKQLLSVMDNPKGRAIITVLLRTGMRIGELLNTKMKDLHLRERRIDIYEGEKNRIGRVVYLSDDAVVALEAWLKMRDVEHDFLFYAQGRKSMAYSTARLIFEKYLTKAGLTHKGYSLHALRHTFASDLLNAGMRIECLHSRHSETNGILCMQNKSENILPSSSPYDGHADVECGYGSLYDPGSFGAQLHQDDPTVLPGIKPQGAKRLLQSYGGDHAKNGLQPKQWIGLSRVTHSPPRLATLKSRGLRLWITPCGEAVNKINLTNLDFMVLVNTT